MSLPQPEERPEPRQVLGRAERMQLKARWESRNYFHAFRRYVRPDLIWGWWNQHVAFELDQFVKDFELGKRPKLVLATPPQHGKSSISLDLIGYVVGRNLDRRVIFASYSDDLSIRANTELQRLIRDPRYQELFPHARLGGVGTRYQCNTTLIEFVGRRGSFRNTTIERPINGFSLDFGIIDDPLKGRGEARSKAVRDHVWDWFTNDWMGRFDKDAAMILIGTCWHVDDPLSRFLEHVPDVKVVRFPAIAEEDEYIPVMEWDSRRKRFFRGPHRKVRSAGEALFPEHKPLDFLLSRKQLMTQADWESVYQQHPIIVGGGQLPIDKLHVVPFFDAKEIKLSVRYVDKAATSGGIGAYTAMVLLHLMKDDTYLISDVQRGHWSALEREQRIKKCAMQDRQMLGGMFAAYEVGIEQEPGSGGKESAEATIRNLAGFRVYADKVTGSKEVRADPFAAQVQGGNVGLVAGPPGLAGLTVHGAERGSRAAHSVAGGLSLTRGSTVRGLREVGVAWPSGRSMAVSFDGR
jgi:phage terminase large subunit-like protein